MPTGTASAPGRWPPRVLVRLVRLPERKVPRVFLPRAGLLSDHVFRPRAGEPAVVREPRHAKVHVAGRLVSQTSGHQLPNERNDLGDRVRGQGLDVRPAETEGARVLEVPPGRAPGQFGAADSLGPRRIIDLVVDVGDVQDQPRLVA